MPLAQRRLGPWIGAAASLLLHGVFYLVLSWAGTAPTVDIEIVLPQHIELGLTEATPARALAPPTVPESVPEPEPAAASEDAPAKPATSARDAGTKRRDAGHDAGAPDAAVAKPVAGPPKPLAVKGEVRDAGVFGGDAGRPLLAAYAPPGAMLSMRMHMARVRQSPFADDVRDLLTAIPDWALLLDDSGIDPLRDLERLMLASPNLARESLVVVGQYAGDDTLPQRAVKNLAQARGRTVRWSTRSGIPVAPWYNRDTTKRMVALIGPQQFAITKPDDLARVIEVAQGLAARAAQELEAKSTKSGERAEQVEPTAPADALLALPERRMLAVSVDGAREFVRAVHPGVPERAEAWVGTSEDDDAKLVLEAVGWFEDEKAAERAAKFWEQTRERFLNHPIVAFVGMRGPLASTEIVTHEAQLEVRSQLSVQQAKLVIGFVANALRPMPPGSPRTKLPRLPRPARGGKIEPPGAKP